MVERLGCSKVHCLAGLGGSREQYLRSLERARKEVAPLEVLIEPINQRSMCLGRALHGWHAPRPGYHLHCLRQATEICQQLGVRLLFDLFHVQILHGDLAENLREAWPVLGHIQIAGVPERHEPDHRQGSLLPLG